MKITEITLGDIQANQIILDKKHKSDKLLKLLINIYDKKNLSSKLNDKSLGLNYPEITRDKLSRWSKNSDENPIILDERAITDIRSKLLPTKPVHWENPSFEFIDLFAGIGGIRKGFEQIGGKCVFTCEWEEKARRTYLANHYVSEAELPYFLDSKEENPLKNTDFMDITQITLSKNVNLSDEERANHICQHIPQHDVLLAGFPCQPFSLAGVSKKNSLGRAHGFECETQGTLFFDVEQIIAARKPKFFVLENVKNLKSHDKGKTFAVIIRTLHRLGYWIADISDQDECIEKAIEKVRKRKAEPVIVDAMDYIPQHRERVILVGVRKDVCIDKSSFSLTNLVKPKARLTVEEILYPLTKEENNKYTLTPNLWNYLYNYALKHMTQGNGFGFGLVDPRNPNAVTRTLSARYYKDGSEILINHQGIEKDYLESKKSACVAKINDRNQFVNDRLKLYGHSMSEAEKKALIVDAEDEFNKKHGRYSNEFDPLYKTPRRLLPKECARLMGFEKPLAYRGPNDTDFRIVCADASAYKQFGNSVVVPVFEAVANFLKPYIEKS